MKTLLPAAIALAWLLATPGSALAQPAAGTGVYYQCPGNVFTNTITAKEAEQRGCKTREASQPTSIPAPRNRPVQAGARGSDARVDASDQKARDSDARRILEAELRKSEDQLDALRKEYNNGEPERRGDEKNYQKYLDRVADLKASIARTEADIAALKREIAKTP